MANRQQLSMVINSQITRLIELIIDEYDISELDAIKNLYESQLYKLLSKEETKLWWLSAHALLEVYKVEKETGDVFASNYVLENAT